MAIVNTTIPQPVLHLDLNRGTVDIQRHDSVPSTVSESTVSKVHFDLSRRQVVIAPSPSLPTDQAGSYYNMSSASAATEGVGGIITHVHKSVDEQSFDAFNDQSCEPASQAYADETRARGEASIDMNDNPGTRPADHAVSQLPRFHYSCMGWEWDGGIRHRNELGRR